MKPVTSDYVLLEKFIGWSSVNLETRIWVLMIKTRMWMGNWREANYWNVQAVWHKKGNIKIKERNSDKLRRKTTFKEIKKWGGESPKNKGEKEFGKRNRKVSQLLKKRIWPGKWVSHKLKMLYPQGHCIYSQSLVVKWKNDFLFFQSSYLDLKLWILKYKLVSLILSFLLMDTW